MHKLDIEYFCIKYKKSKSSGRRMGKYKAKEVKDLSEYLKLGMRKYNQQKQSLTNHESRGIYNRNQTQTS